MSAEQARGDEDIDGRSDVYRRPFSTSRSPRAPFDGPNYNQLMVNILMTPHRPAIELNPALPRDLSEIIDRTLDKDRDKRIRTARELSERLDDLGSRITGTPYPGAPTRPRTMPPPPSPSPTPTETWVDVTTNKNAKTPVAVWISGAVFAIAVISIGAVAVARSAPPVADVASRSTAVLSEARSRLATTLAAETKPEEKQPQIEQIAAPVTTASSSAGTVLDADDLPSSTPSADAGVRRLTPPLLIKKKKPGANGSVTNPGF
jgi:serine/threonine protein kinase